MALLKNCRILRLSLGDGGPGFPFASAGYSHDRAGMALTQDEPRLTGVWVHGKPFEGTEEDLPISMYRLPIETARPLTGEVCRAYERTLASLLKRF